jgi:putative flavoprotein involved in K+ transport
MKHTDCIIIGGGQAGLAMSRCLVEHGIDHVVLERGRVGQRWRSESWDSLQLLTPNWQSRLPGFRYEGNDPQGFMRVPELVGHLERFAASFDVPLQENTSVQSVAPDGDDFRVTTDRGVWIAPTVVVATGYAMKPYVPECAEELPSHITQVVPTRYKRPSQLPAGGVLVVGASATGVQLAAEIHRSGRPVTLSVGRHIRMPRRYRGKDIMWWLDRSGLLDETADEVADLDAAKRQPSLQLVGRDDNGDIDLALLQARGVKLVGGCRAIDGPQVRFADDLAVKTAAADQKLRRLLDRIDAYAARHGLGDGRGERPAPMRVAAAPTAIDLEASGIRTVLWATGYRRHYPWLHVDVLDDRGEIRQHRGISAVDGLYTMGLMFQGRRKSSYIDGVADDAEELAAHIAERLAGPQSRAA